MKKRLVLLLAFLANIGFAFSQNAQQVASDIVKEKTEWRIKAREANKQLPATGAENERSFTESVISSVSTEVQSEVHAAINPTDSNNIAVSSNFVSTGAGLPTQTNYIYYTNDFGATWQTSNFVTGPLTPNALIGGGGDPNFVFTDQGKLYFSWINLWTDPSTFNTLFDLYWAYSFDGGNAWHRDTTSDLIGSQPSSLFGGGGAFDKEWLASDNNPVSPYYGNLYCSFLEADANSGNVFIGVRKKDAASNTFDTVSAQVNSVNYQFIQFSSITTDRAGKVHVTFFGSTDTATYSIFHSVSNDGGVTFRPENKVSDVSLTRYTSGQKNDPSILGVDSNRMYPCAYIVCDNSTGANRNNLYVTWTANGVSSKLNNGNDIYFSRSTDGGTTWSTPAILNDNTTNLSSDQYYPSISVSTEGRLVVSWWDKRDDLQNKQANIYLTYSDNGGQTFAPDIKVTNAATDFSQVGAVNGGFGIGEYNAVLANGHYAIPVWADGRNNNGALNLYAAFVDLGSSPAAATGLRNITSINGAIKIYSVFPNPASDILNLAYETSEPGKIEMSIVDVNGKLVKKAGVIETRAAKGTTQLNISELATGNYFLKVMFNGAMNLRKFIKM